MVEHKYQKFFSKYNKFINNLNKNTSILTQIYSLYDELVKITDFFIKEIKDKTDIIFPKENQIKDDYIIKFKYTFKRVKNRK